MATDWQRALVALSVTVVTITVVAVMYFAKQLVIPIALAIFLTFVLSPLVTRLQHLGLGRVPAVIVTLGLVGLLSVGIGDLIAHQVVQLANTLPDRREAIKEKIVAAKKWAMGDGENRFGQLIDDVSGAIMSSPSPEGTFVVERASPSMAARFDAYLSPAAEFMGQAALTFILTVFMLLNREDLRNRAIWLFGDGRVTATTKAVDDASQRVSRYLLSQLLVNTAFGALIATGLFFLGVAYPLLWGFLAALMRYVPYIGTWVGLVPPILFTVATAPDWGGGWGQPLAVLALYIGLELISGNLVEPKVYGHSMGISEVAQLTATAFWAYLWGPIGLILSGPLTVCLLVLGRHVTRFHVLAVVLGNVPPLKPRVAFYQRLAARDQDEAEEIALKMAREIGVEGVFDEVIMPALCLARRDAAAGDLDDGALRYVVRASGEIAEEVAGLMEHPGEGSTVRGRLLISPARDDSERVASEMLCLTLNPARWEVKVAGNDLLASELIELVAEFRPDAVVVVSMPPGGVGHARYLVSRLRQHIAELKVLVGRWGCIDDTVAAPEEGIPDTDGIDRTLADTRKNLAALHLLLPARESPTQPQKKDEKLVGTASA